MRFGFNPNKAELAEDIFLWLQEVDLIREQVQKLVSMPMWMCLLPVNITVAHISYMSFTSRCQLHLPHFTKCMCYSTKTQYYTRLKSVLVHISRIVTHNFHFMRYYIFHAWPLFEMFESDSRFCGYSDETAAGTEEGPKTAEILEPHY